MQLVERMCTAKNGAVGGEDVHSEVRKKGEGRREGEGGGAYQLGERGQAKKAWTTLAVSTIPPDKPSIGGEGERHINLFLSLLSITVATIVCIYRMPHS